MSHSTVWSNAYPIFLLPLLLVLGPRDLTTQGRHKRRQYAHDQDESRCSSQGRQCALEVDQGEDDHRQGHANQDHQVANEKIVDGQDDFQDDVHRRTSFSCESIVASDAVVADATRGCRCLMAQISNNDAARYRAASRSRNRSENGQSMPKLSPDQNVPKVVSMIPTINFKVFSGTFWRGACTKAPTRITSRPAAVAPRVTNPMPLAPPPPKEMTIKATSSPSSSTDL